MNESMEQLLIEALDLMEQGLGVDEIAGRYPEQAAELRPFLLTAFALSNLATQPVVTAEQKSKEALLAAAERGAAQRARPAAVAGGWLRLVAPALALLAVVFLAGAGLVGASSFAAPGDALYGTKRFIEATRLNLTADPERAAELREGFRQERIREIERLLADGRQVDVSLTGIIESMTPELWTVAGVPVAVSAATEIDGEPVVGALAQVDGRTAEGVVTAERVIVRAGGPEPVDDRNEPETARPTPQRVVPTAVTPVVPPTSDAGARPPSLPTATASPTPTATVSPTPTTAASSTPVASPTSEPPPTSPPTATPDDDDNGNDNDDDNDDDDNDNDDDNGNVNDNDDDNGNDNDDDDANDNDDDNDNDGNGNDNDDDDNGGGDDD